MKLAKAHRKNTFSGQAIHEDLYRPLIATFCMMAGEEDWRSGGDTSRDAMDPEEMLLKALLKAITVCGNLRNILPASGSLSSVEDVAEALTLYLKADGGTLQELFGAINRVARARRQELIGTQQSS